MPIHEIRIYYLCLWHFNKVALKNMFPAGLNPRLFLEEKAEPLAWPYDTGMTAQCSTCVFRLSERGSKECVDGL